MESRKCRKRVVRNEVKEVKGLGHERPYSQKKDINLYYRHSKELAEEHRSNIVII